MSTFFSIPTVKHILFWLGIYAYFVSTVSMKYYSGYVEVLEHFAIHVFCQSHRCLYYSVCFNPSLPNTQETYSIYCKSTSITSGCVCQFLLDSMNTIISQNIWTQVINLLMILLKSFGKIY